MCGSEELFIILKKISLIALAISVGLGVSCQRQKAPVNSDYFKTDTEPKKVILKVEDKEYKEDNFFQYLVIQVGQDYRQLSSSVLSRLLDQFIEEKLLAVAAQSEGLVVSEEEKEAFKTRFRVQGEESSVFLVDDWAITERLLSEKYLDKIIANITVAEEEVETYYELHQREFLLPERVAVSQILVDSEAKAVRLQNQLKDKNDEAFFRKLARENSLGPEASRDGKLGVFSFNELPQEMAKVVFSLREAELSPVVESPYGFHIFRLDARLEPKLLTRQEAAAKIRTKLLESKIEGVKARKLEELKTNLDWEFLPQRLSFQYEKEGQ